ncbi:hypothetical protein QBC47DRAFT_293087 [Echria macrotheca]|uniref:C2H2-type domain-containing protein n=1 Tax=Echria macrotheca TaxID=438768 RepID=A0AAJ0BIV4_9PEZI|nr:hypothetical protein QBC47DRAFT_293087 [Echria macrotheca]
MSPPYECDYCYQSWDDKGDRNDHEVEDHFYCRGCDRRFGTYNSIKQHMRSRIHSGKDMGCPFCKRSFVSATGLTHHLETGSCSRARNIDRQAVYSIVRARDPRGAISKKLLTWEGDSDYEATGESWNGEFYECYLCHREFGKLQGLNQHLNSPAHQQSLYHCPQGGCRTDFKTLASLINHLESESCGFMRFEAVQKRMGNLVSSNHLLTF